MDEQDPAYGRYLDNLKRAGFFGDEMEGSEGWTRRMRETKEGWVRVRGDRYVVFLVSFVDIANRSPVARHVRRLPTRLTPHSRPQCPSTFPS